MIESILSGIGLTAITLPQSIMLILALVLMYLAIKKEYEPLLLLPIAFGMLIANIPLASLSAYDEGGLLYHIYQGVKIGLYPPLIFLCIGAMTDFGPLIAAPRSALIGMGAQFGIFCAFGMAVILGRVFPDTLGFTFQEAAAIGIIGGADGPTAIYSAIVLAPHLLPAITIAAYSYMALVPIIQPPIMRAMTTPEERVIVMPEPSRVTQTQKILFPILMTLVVSLLIPEVASLVAMLMLGNLIRECGVTERFVRTLSRDFLNILTIAIGLSVGSTATAERMLNPQTILIIVLGLIAFSFGTVGGITIAKILCVVTGGKVNPLIGNAGVSAIPMSARESQKMGQFYNPRNHLLMHAMGPMVSGVLGSAIAAGILMNIFGQ